MKILRSLNKIFLFKVLFMFCFTQNIYSNEPVDIWNINNSDNTENQEKSVLDEVKESSSILENIKNNNLSSVELEDNLDKNEKSYLAGLFDPADNDLTLSMWEISDGDNIRQIIKKINKLNLSNDAKDLYNKLILTNALPPKNNLSGDEFLKLKTNWLIKKNDLDLINKFILKNTFDLDNDLLKYYLNQNLSENNLTKACEILVKVIF